MESNLDLSKYNHSFSLQNKISRLVWNVIRFVLFRPFGSRFFKKWRVLVLKCFGAKIKWSSHVYASVKIWAPWNLEMQAYATLGPNVDCYNQGKITIGAHTTISQKAYLCASSHDISDKQNNLILKPIVIEDQVWVAAEAFVGPGVKIKQGSVIGARSAVFKDVEPWGVVGGNPAKLIKKRVLKY
ncbi:LbetaH domain-containing protein [Polaribacter sp. M15]